MSFVPTASPCLRSDDRVRTRLRVSYGLDALECSSFVESISPGGVYINTNEVFKVGTRLALRIEFGERAVCLQGEVTWAIRVPEGLKDRMVCGMGVAFIDPDPQWPELFLTWKESLEPSPD
jgi:Tfp pilus assembly protein PilZ